MHHFHHLSYVGEYIRSFGFLAPAVALILFIIQAAIPIFPYAVLVAAGVIVFGWKMGFLLSMLGAVLGSVLSYWACRELGAEWFNKKILKRWGYDTGAIHSKIAFWGIAVAHMVPVLPSSMITLAAAISRVSFWNFTLATVLGLIPLTVAYSGLGMFLFYIQDVHKALVTLAVVMVLLFLGKDILKRKLGIKETSLESQQ